MSLRNKNILITAGPTWVPIDKVRVISNIATGETGILLAENLKNLGARVTLVLGPAASCPSGKKIRLIRFNFFDELRGIIVREVRTKKYDIVIHSAAVSDYRPGKSYGRKVKSGIRNWKLKLLPTVKIIDLIKRIDPSLFLVGFKFQPGLARNTLIKEAKRLKHRLGLGLVVANGIDKNRYLAYVLGCGKIYGPWLNKKYLVKGLVNIIREKI